MGFTWNKPLYPEILCINHDDQNVLELLALSVLCKYLCCGSTAMLNILLFHFHSCIHLFINYFLYAFVRYFVCSFVHLFIH